ncbi:MAG: thioredoxin fold domain-containing protein [Gammaproteobacteria bacterium]
MTYLQRILVLWLSLAGVAVAADDYPQIRQALSALIPDAQPDQIRPAPVAGLLEVTYGPQLFYVSDDGRYLVQGHVFDVRTQADLTEARQGELRTAAVAGLGADKMVIFAAAKPKHTITVFTDIDCGYCRKLHAEIQEANALGITVRYLFYPRSGPNTESYFKAESVWCSKDRQQAMTDAKAGKELPRKTCDNPIDAHLRLVRDFGLQGTPAILLEDGRLIPGYVPAKQLLAMLEGKAQP